MFIVHYSNITMFYHTHIIDGISYSHSHLYWFDKTSNSVALPEHSNMELKLIHDLNQISWSSDVEIPELPTPVFILLTEFILLPAIKSTAHNVLYYSLRAPPLYL